MPDKDFKPFWAKVIFADLMAQALSNTSLEERGQWITDLCIQLVSGSISDTNLPYANDLLQQGLDFHQKRVESGEKRVESKKVTSRSSKVTSRSPLGDPEVPTDTDTDTASDKKSDPSQKAICLYDMYPRKVNRLAALKAIEKAIKEHGYDFLVDEVEKYARKRLGADQNYTPHPSTWFNGKRWEDEEGPADKRLKNGLQPGDFYDNGKVTISARMRLGVDENGEKTDGR